MNTLWKRVAIIVAVLIPVAVVGAVVMKQNDNDGDDVVQTTTPTTSAGVESTNPAANVGTNTTSTTAAYTDGTYQATGSYMTPEGTQSILVSLVVANDIVTQATVTSQATGGTSKMWQAKFISGVQAQVVGKKLASLHLTKVSGSSLTPIGFNSAVSDIQNQAKS